jgi:hypothetical protein
MRTCSAPSPSTRASASTSMRRVASRARRPQVRFRSTSRPPSGTGRRRRCRCAGRAASRRGRRRARRSGRPARQVGLLHRAEAAVAAAREVGAERAAAGLRGGAQAGLPVGDHDAHGAAALALEAHGVVGHLRLAAGQGGADHLEQLPLVDRAAAQLEVDEDVLGDRASRSAAGRGSRGGRRPRGEGEASGPPSGPAKLRSAWMPPAVAQAPITTSLPERSRISRMRCASWAVVIEPSTSETS